MMVVFTHRNDAVDDMDVRNEEWIPGSNHESLKLLVCECKEVIRRSGRSRIMPLSSWGIVQGSLEESVGERR
jgi:hypothetical protein